MQTTKSDIMMALRTGKPHVRQITFKSRERAIVEIKMNFF